MVPKLLRSIVAIFVQLPLYFLQLLFELITKLLLIRAPSWRQPPGPLANWLPICGSLPLFSFGPSYLMLTRMAEMYGRIFRLQLGNTTFVVIADLELLKETFEGNDVCGRRPPPLMDVMNNLGIVHAEGARLQDQRAFFDKVMSCLNFCTDPMRRTFDTRAYDSMRELQEELHLNGGQATDIDASLGFTITNILFSTLVGTKFEREDQELMSLIHNTHETFRSSELISFANFLHGVAGLSLFRNQKKAVLDRKQSFANYMRWIVEIHSRRRDDILTRPDLIDAFIVQMAGLDKQRRRFFTESQLYALLGDVFSMSLETISATVHWLLLAILHNPQIQGNIQNEMDNKLSLVEMVTVLHREEMPYLEATIMEGLRFSSILPIGSAHTAIRDTTIAGYAVPENAMVVGLFWKFHRDPALWKHDPSKFEPTNHLNDRGLIKPSPHLMPFSTGRRACPADQAAQSVIFVILANLLHRFNIAPEEGTELPSLDESVDGVLRLPFPFKIRFIPRQYNS